MKGRIYKIAGNTCVVHAGSRAFECKFAGRLKKERTHTLKLAAVGDDVEFEPENIRDGVIHEVLPSRTRFSRADVQKPTIEQVIAANIDRIIIVQAAADPDLDLLTIDRCTVMSETNSLPCLLCVNKMDLADRKVHDLIEPYRRIGIEVVFTCAKTSEGLDSLREAIRGRTSVFMGPSGVGKTSLLQCLLPGREFKTGEVSERTGEGRHTTSWVELVEVEPGTLVVDTPGLEFFTLWGVTLENLADQFVDFIEPAAQCKYPHCSHTQEAKCGVLAVLEDGTLLKSRHASYLRLRKELIEKRMSLSD